MTINTPSKEILDVYFNEDGAAAQVNRTKQTLVRWRKEGGGPPFTKIGRTYYYRKTSLLKWLESLETAAA